MNNNKENIFSKNPNISQEESEYLYLKELNEKLTLFKSKENEEVQEEQKENDQIKR